MYSFIKNIKSTMLNFAEEASDDGAAPVDTNAKSNAYHTTESKVPNSELLNKTIKLQDHR